MNSTMTNDRDEKGTLKKKELPFGSFSKVDVVFIF